jgi:Flp pilus assembly pilin Flp
MDAQVISVGLLILVQSVLLIAYVSRLGTRVGHCEKGMTELWQGHNNHEAELRALGEIKGKLDTLILLQKKEN